MLLVVVALVAALPGDASPQVLDLREVLPALLRDGILLAPPDNPNVVSHQAHFTGSDSPQLRALQQVSGEIYRQIAVQPLSSSAGGFAYELDPTLGVLSRPTQSFGPVYAERPLTVGRGKFNAGLSYTKFSFDHLDDLSLREGDLSLVFTHLDVDGDGTTMPGFEGDLVTARVTMRAESEVRTLALTYGVAERFDLAVAVPWVSVDLDFAAVATVQRLATSDASPTHEFPNGSTEQTISRGGSASGIGDIVLRGKYLMVERGDGYMAVAGDVRLPTGEERDLLGSGEAQGTISVLGFMNRHPIAPHVNLGYAVGGGDLPEQLLYTLGFDCAVDPKLTLAFDFLGSSVTDVSEVSVKDQDFVYNTTLNPNDPPNFESATFPVTTLEDPGTRSILHGSVGLKVNFFQNALLSANGLFPLTDAGLRDDFSTLVGIDYSF
jgi:hypothetical protein